MTESLAELVLSLEAADRAELDRRLEEAERIMRTHAMNNRRGGVLVTRTGLNSFTVEVSEDVPFGLTRQRQDW